MRYSEVIRYLNEKGLFGIHLGLKRIKELLKKLGNPEKSLKLIHVAGTNGKGSVCAMLSAILQEASYKVGMYTSPHLVKINERYKINGRAISDKEFVRYFLKVRPFIRGQTYFEITTTMAFLYFKEKKVDFLISEVGLGGKLDATNVARPLISVITNIGLEHTEHLGKTLAGIAYEKAGIIKKNVPVITAAKGSALNVIKKISKERNSELFVVKKINKKIKLALKGDFQLKNAAVALKTIGVLKNYYNIKTTESHIKNGLKKVKWPGRFQFIGKNILIDCAHNSDGAKVLASEIKKIKNRYNKIILVIGILNDKNIRNIVKEIAPLTDFALVTMPREARAEDPKKIASHFKKFNENYRIIKKAKEAFKYAKSIAKNKDLILITGSCYLVGEFIELYQ